MEKKDKMLEKLNNLLSHGSEKQLRIIHTVAYYIIFGSVHKQ